MNNKEINVNVAHRVATVTLSRPEKLNAWTSTMEQGFRHVLNAAENDDNVRVIVVTGAGRGFCAGADISILSSVRSRASAQAKTGNSETAGPNGKVYTCFPDVSKPIIAAINGPAVGLGLVIALYCDLRIASTNAKFSTAFARRGLIAEYGVAWLLLRTIGLTNANDLLFSARMIDAQEAYCMGLISRVFPQEDFADRVQEYARDLADNVSPRSLAVMKRQIYATTTGTLAEALDSSNREMLASFKCEDFKEGVAHFIEKRAPNFTGK